MLRKPQRAVCAPPARRLRTAQIRGESGGSGSEAAATIFGVSASE